MSATAPAPRTGFIRQKDKNFLTVRAKVTAGVLKTGQMEALAKIAAEFGRGELYITSRMNFEIPWIKDSDQEAVAARLLEAGLPAGSVGPTVRAIVCCKGTTCKNGLIDTHGLCRELDKKFYARKLPAKFKMRIAGCPNNCVMAKTNDLDMTACVIPEPINQERCVKCGACAAVCPVKAISRDAGDAFIIDSGKCVGCGKCVRACAHDAIGVKTRGLRIYAGGRFGRKQRMGTALDGVFAEKDIPELAEKLIAVYAAEAGPKERFEAVIGRLGVTETQRRLTAAP
jgi:dissimilatory sulfite reductase (desulfoviridin) alpha/beta subunit